MKEQDELEKLNSTLMSATGIPKEYLTGNTASELMKDIKFGKRLAMVQAKLFRGLADKFSDPKWYQFWYYSKWTETKEIREKIRTYYMQLATDLDKKYE